MPNSPSLGRIESSRVLTAQIPEVRFACPAIWKQIWEKGQKKMFDRMTPQEKADWNKLAKADTDPPGVAVKKPLPHPVGYGFGEAAYARLLRETGCDCWPGARLFHHEKGADRAFEYAVTRHIKELLAGDRFQDPAQFGLSFVSTLRSPDLVARRPDGRWAFYEVKQKDPPLPGQLEALLALHLLTGGEVGIVRVVPEDRSTRPGEKMHEVALCYKGRLSEFVATPLRNWVEEAERRTPSTP